jgi:HAD superfamily hydrolase (TIGR01549 family)
MKRRPRVILFDLWRTLGYSLDIEPIHEVQKMLGHGVHMVGGQMNVHEDPSFMHACLTTNIQNQREFLAEIGRRFNCQISDESYRQFSILLQREVDGFRLYDDSLAALDGLKKRGYRLGLVSNLWPFPASFIFDELGLGKYFEHRIYSFAAGYAKPEPGIYLRALDLFAVKPNQVLMVGDNLINDVRAAMAVGMRAALIDRTGSVNACSGVPVLGTLLDLGRTTLQGRKKEIAA